jgi:hypothetical protein
MVLGKTGQERATKEQEEHYQFSGRSQTFTPLCLIFVSARAVARHEASSYASKILVEDRNSSVAEFVPKLVPGHECIQSVADWPGQRLPSSQFIE